MKIAGRKNPFSAVLLHVFLRFESVRSEAPAGPPPQCAWSVFDCQGVSEGRHGSQRSMTVGWGKH